jgi:hypothetical protein
LGDLARSLHAGELPRHGDGVALFQNNPAPTGRRVSIAGMTIDRVADGKINPALGRCGGLVYLGRLSSGRYYQFLM